MGCNSSSSDTSREAPIANTSERTIPKSVARSNTFEAAVSIDPDAVTPFECPLAGVLSVEALEEPLKKPSSYRHPTTMTLSDLNEHRNAFWKSRSGGSMEIWAIIRSAADALLADDILLATSILKLMRVEASHGSLELCHDEFGRSYRTPVYCFVDPLNVIRPTTKNLVHRKLVSKKSSLSSFYNQHISLRIRINPGMFDLNIIAATSDTILDLKHLILEQSSQQTTLAIPICEEIRQRIVYMGQELENAQLLRDVGADETKIIQVFLRPVMVSAVNQQ